MIKINNLLNLFIIILLIILWGCNSGQVKTDTSNTSMIGEKDSAFEIEGFTDDNTFQVVSQGTWAPEDTSASEEIKRIKAGEKAKLNVKIKAIGLFQNFILVNSKTNNISKDIKLNIENLVNSGKITKMVFDKENNCMLIYLINSERLKKKLEAGLK